MRAPLARSLSEIVELSPFEATRPKVFDLVSIFLFLGGLSSFQSFCPPHLSLDYFQQVSEGGEGGGGLEFASKIAILVELPKF